MLPSGFSKIFICLYFFSVSPVLNVGLELIIRTLPTEPARRSGFFFYSYTEVKEEFLVAVLGR